MGEDQFNKLSQQVSEISQALSRHGQMISDLNDTVLKLYQHMETRFDHLDATKADKQQVADIATTLDGLAKRLETDDQERAALAHQVDRHDTWIGQLAKATHTKLVPEP